MKNLCYLAIFTVLFIPFAVQAEPTEEEKNPSAQSNDVSDSLMTQLSSIDGVDPQTKMLLDETVKVILLIRSDFRKNNEVVYNAIKTIRKNVNGYAKTAPDSEKKAIKTIRDNLRHMLSQSYKDGMARDGDLFDRVRDSGLLLEKEGAVSINEFSEELELFYEQYLSTLRFRAAVGFGYFGIPDIEYTDRYALSASNFVTPPGSPTSPSVVHSTQFDNKGYFSPVVRLEMANAYMQLAFLPRRFDQNTTDPIRRANVSGAPSDLLFQRTVESEMTVYFDALLEIGLMRTLNSLLDIDFLGQREDLTFGAGLLGLNIEDKIKTIFKSDDGTSTFSDLATLDSTESTEDRDVVAGYISLGYVANVSNDIQTSFNVRYFDDALTMSDAADISGYSVSLQVSYFPFENQ